MLTVELYAIVVSWQGVGLLPEWPYYLRWPGGSTMCQL